MAIRSPGRMQLGGWKAGLYIDESATEAKRTAIQNIFTGMAGAPMKIIFTQVLEYMGVQFVSIRTTFEEDERTVDIPDVLSAAVDSLEGNRGGKVILENTPPTFWLPARLTQVRSKHYRYKDFEMGGEWEGRHFLYSNFEWSGP